MNIPRIVLAGTHSGVGKTTIATGLMANLTALGYKVQPYKVGPDYIDPSYHSYATGLISRNLDTWLTGEKVMKQLFANTSTLAGVAVIEGVMGLFDGHQNSRFKSSTAEIAKLLDAPVILIINCKSMAQSAAAMVLGYKNFDPELKLAGVILNKIGSQTHLKMVKKSIEDHTKVPVVGYIGSHQDLTLPERHLGLVPVAEREDLRANFASLAKQVGQNLDIKQILAIANSSAALDIDTALPETVYRNKVRVAIARDEAFSFYYQDSLDYLQQAGVEWLPFSPLHDSCLPVNSSGLFIGGGFPEMFLERLAANKSLKNDIQSRAEQGLPIYAECGGLMYLCLNIIDFNNESYPMLGLVPAQAKMEKRLAGMGYRECKAIRPSIIAGAGEKIRGHEFHYSSLLIEDENSFPWAYKYESSNGRCKLEGYAKGNILASYLHCHFAGNITATAEFINSCRRFANRRNAS